MRTHLRGPLILFALLVAYGVSLGRTVDYGFVWDDVPEIARDASFDRPLVEGLRLTQVERGAADLAQLDQLAFGYDSYRPLLYVTLWTDVRAWGRAPEPLHRTNVVLGALAILLAFAVARHWVGPELAWIPTAVFALHPAQIETVAYISARGDLLAGLFALATTSAVLRAAEAPSLRHARAWTCAAILAFAMSLLSKEAYIALPIALAVLVHGRSRSRWWIAASLAVTAFAYLGLRSAMLVVEARPEFGTAAASAPALVVDYLRIAALPFDLSIERPPRTSLLVGWGIALLAVVALGVALVRARRTGGPTRWSRDALAGGVWALVLLGPSLVAASTMQVVADRYLYAPLFGFAIAVTLAATRLASARPSLRRPLAIAAALWGAAIVLVGWRQVPVWTDATTLYTHAAEMVPDSSRANYRVAVLAIGEGDWDRAVPRLERAIELDPDNFEALNNLAVYELRRGRPAEAESLLQRAVAANAARFNAWNNLGLAQLAQGKRAEACRSIERSLSINPGYEPARREHARTCGGKMAP